MARVTLVFDNSTRVFDSDFDEIEITRQILRANNEASYFINKTPCRLKDINDLVMDTGLGKDSLSIITQGNISSFADAEKFIELGADRLGTSRLVKIMKNV